MDKLDGLVLKLYKKTKDGQIHWDKTSYPEVFQASFSNYSVTISFSPSYDVGRGDVIIKIISIFGETIEEITPKDISSANLSEFRELYTLARRDAMDLEKALDDILGELE